LLNHPEHVVHERLHERFDRALELGRSTNGTLLARAERSPGGIGEGLSGCIRENAARLVGSRFGCQTRLPLGASASSGGTRSRDTVLARGPFLLPLFLARGPFGALLLLASGSFLGLQRSFLSRATLALGSTQGRLFGDGKRRLTKR
jgi:hypothetical protein